jgi:hypothetical protein
MIYFNINIRNPNWANRFESLWFRGGATFWKNKFWEVQIMKNDPLLRIEFDFTTRQDHAGLQIELALFGYEIHFSFHDSRHWHYEKNRWVDYDNPAELEELYGQYK